MDSSRPTVTAPTHVLVSAPLPIVSALHVANLLLEVLQLLLSSGVLLGHLLELGLPLIAVCLESLDFALKVTSLDISLAEPMHSCQLFPQAQEFIPVRRTSP